MANFTMGFPSITFQVTQNAEAIAQRQACPQARSLGLFGRDSLARNNGDKLSNRGSLRII
jgi:hypothetical protein